MTGACFAFCLPKIAWSAPLLENVYLDCATEEPWIGASIQHVIDNTALKAWVYEHPLRPIKNLELADYSAGWLGDLFRLIQPQFVNVHLTIDRVCSDLPVKVELETIRELAKWSGLKKVTVDRDRDEDFDEDWEEEYGGLGLEEAHEDQCDYVKGLKELCSERQIELTVDHLLARALAEAETEQARAA